MTIFCFSSELPIAFFSFASNAGIQSITDPVGPQHFLEECLDDYNLMILSFKAAIDADQRVAPEPSQGVRQHSWRELCGGFSGLNQPRTEFAG